MGYMRHHAIIVTSWDANRLATAHAKASELFARISPIIPSSINGYGYASFFIPPDGWKEGWAESDNGDSQRNLYVEWLDLQRYGDGSSWLKWAEVQYGNEDGDNRLVRNAAHLTANPEVTP